MTFTCFPSSMPFMISSVTSGGSGWCSTVRDLRLDDLLLTASALHDDVHLLPLVHAFHDLLRDLFVIIRGLANLHESRQVQVVLGLTTLHQEAHLAGVIVCRQELVLHR